MRPTSFIRRLGPHHFAHLRAVAEGIAVADSARRYLGIEHGHEAATAHRQTVDMVRAIARRKGHRAWRLIGAAIRIHEPDSRPTLSYFIADHHLEDWSESEQIALYAASGLVEGGAQAKALRRQKLRDQQLQLLRELEISDAQQPSADDMVSGWFDERIAAKLIGAGHLNLGQLRQTIATGGRWYAGLPGIGRSKAQRIAGHLQTLLPAPIASPQGYFSAAVLAVMAASESVPVACAPAAGRADTGEAVALLLPSSNAPPGSLLEARNDTEAVRIWVQTHAGSAATVKSFWREARVLLLWLQLERQGLRFAQLKVDDCLAFKAFLENIPPHWISRQRARPGHPGWAPFRGPLSEASRHHVLNIVGSLFAYLKLADYLRQNPWPLIKTRVSMKKTAANTLDTRALSAEAHRQITQFIAACPASAAQARMCFIVDFLAAVGLRSSEFLAATAGDIRHTAYGYALEVRGKGGKQRVVALPPAAITALNRYLLARGWSDLASAPPHAPLLSSTQDAMAPISYQALYLTVRAWLGKAIERADIADLEKRSLRGATTHWLRHTFATRAIEREVPMEVVQAQLGHTSINTTMNIYAKASLQRQLSGIAAAFK